MADNAGGVIFYSDNNEPCTSTEHPALGATLNVNTDKIQNTMGLLPYSTTQSDNLVTFPDPDVPTAIPAGGVSLATGFLSDTYIESIKFYLVFDGLGDDLQFQGWGDNVNPLSDAIRVAFSNKDDFDANIAPDEYILEFTNLGELLEWGSVTIARDGVNTYISVDKKFDPPMYLTTNGGLEEPIIQIDIPDSIGGFPGGNGTLSSGTATIMHYQARYRSDREFDDIPYVTPIVGTI